MSFAKGFVWGAAAAHQIEGAACENGNAIDLVRKSHRLQSLFVLSLKQYWKEVYDELDTP